MSLSFHIYLTLTTLGKIFSRRHTDFFLIFPRNHNLTFHANFLHYFFLFSLKSGHFMQIVSNGDNLHILSSPVFWENKVKNNTNLSSSAELAQRMVKVTNIYGFEWLLLFIHTLLILSIRTDRPEETVETRIKCHRTRRQISGYTVSNSSSSI